jgi:hypothetical protein
VAAHVRAEEGLGFSTRLNVVTLVRSIRKVTSNQDLGWWDWEDLLPWQNVSSAHWTRISSFMALSVPCPDGRGWAAAVIDGGTNESHSSFFEVRRTLLS